MSEGFPAFSQPGKKPVINSIYDFSAEALEQFAFWLEQRGINIPISNLVGFSRFQQLCVLTRSAGQVVTSGAYAVLTWDTEVADTGAFHSQVSSTNRITIPPGQDGKYLVGAFVAPLYGATAGNAVLVLTKNTELSGAFVAAGVQAASSNLVFGGASNTYGFSTPLSLVGGDYLSLSFIHTTGVNATVPDVATFPASGFWLTRLS